jgi:hypothetical protein
MSFVVSRVGLVVVRNDLLSMRAASKKSVKPKMIARPLDVKNFVK